MNIGEHATETGAYSLAYAENRDRNPAFLRPGTTDDPLAMRFFEVLSGDPSYISLADGHTTMNILCLLAEACRRNYNAMPKIALIGKHGNPCGVGVDWHTSSTALIKALMGNPVAGMGGELVTNFAIDDALADLAFSAKGYGIGRDNWGLDILLAPGYTGHAVELLGKREKRRLLSNDALSNPILPTEKESIQILRGGDQLIQQPANFILTREAIKFCTGGCMTQSQFLDLLIAWAVAWRASSNTVALAKDGKLIGLGAGQQDRIECARLCIDRAIRSSHDLQGSIFASDAFFPFANSQLPSRVEFEKLAASLQSFQIGNDEDSRSILKRMAELSQRLLLLDKREAAELLIDAGCAGGVVPADGKHLEEVKALFERHLLRVAFLEPEHRGFSKH